MNLTDFITSPYANISSEKTPLVTTNQKENYELDGTCTCEEFAQSWFSALWDDENPLKFCSATSPCLACTGVGVSLLIWNPSSTYFLAGGITAATGICPLSVLCTANCMNSWWKSCSILDIYKCCC